MKICSACDLCFDDSATKCAVEDHGALTKSRNGDCFSVKGYKINSEIKSDFPFKLYKATHLSSEKTVLIKFVKLDSPGQFGELQTQLKAVSQLNHPNLARVFEFGKIDDDEIYIVSENVSGRNLREFLEIKSPLLERHAIKIARQIAEGLEVLHAENIIHRAVNPSNIYFTNAENDDFSVKLQNVDFGGIEQKIVVCGATGIDEKTEIYRYFSPEQFASESIDFKSDLYSLAAVFYEMLLGRSPYEFLSPQAISNYVFDENDVEKLHFDLRALLAYTLKQSFQHRLNLRPPTTNNLARQYRHLELIATPPTIGLQEKQAKRNKQKQIVNVSRLQTFAAKEKNEKPEIIENETPAQETIAPLIDFAPEILPEEKNVSMPEFAGEISAPENVSAEIFVEHKSESSDISESSVEAKTEENAAEKIAELKEPEIYISRETTKLEKQAANNAVINFNTTDLAEFEKAFDNIHITNRDDEEPEQILSEDFEYVEPEFVEEVPNLKAENERQTANPFISYAAPRSSPFNKNYAYAALAIVLFIFGGLTAMSFWQTRSDQTAVQTAPQKEKKKLIEEKKEPIAEPEKMKETAEITEEAPLPQFDGQRTNEIPNAEEVTAKPISNKPVQSEPAIKVENKTAPLAKDKTVEIQNSGKVAKTEPVKKQEKTRTVSLDEIRTTKVIVVGKVKTPVKKDDSTSRPRVVSTSPSGN